MLIDTTRAREIATAVLNEARDNLKTRRGSIVNRDKKHGVAKHIGGHYYLHANYIEHYLTGGFEVLYNQALEILYKHPQTADFQYNIVVLPDRLNNPCVGFVDCPGFDSEREPLRGVGYKVNTATGEVKRMAGENTIYHHKWTFVDDDYPGFNVDDSYNWSKQWLEALDEPANGNSAEGWRRQLERFGLKE